MSKTKKATISASAANRIVRKLIEELGKQHKIEFPTAEKVLWMSRVLHGIVSSSIGQDFALMGGSAIVFLYREMYRFSTDLDLDFIGNKDLGKKGESEIKERQKSDKVILEQIADDLTLGIETKKQKDERFVQYEFIYRSYYTRTGVVELDMSYKYCHSVLNPVSISWPITFGEIIPKFKVQSFRQEELYANKVVAMVDAEERLDFPGQIGLMFKRKVRHLFDVYLLANEILNGGGGVNLRRLHDLIVLFGMTRIKNFQYFRGNAIGLYTDADVRNELISVVPKGVPVPSVEEMKWTVRKFFDIHIFNYAKREHRFIEDFKAHNFRPEDLFGARSIAHRLRAMQYYKEVLGKVRTL